MDMTSGNCLETGVVGANGNLTLQPGCNVPNDNQARPLCLSNAGIQAQKLHSRLRQAWLEVMLLLPQRRADSVQLHRCGS